MSAGLAKVGEDVWENNTWVKALGQTKQRSQMDFGLQLALGMNWRLGINISRMGSGIQAQPMNFQAEPGFAGSGEPNVPPWVEPPDCKT